MKRLRASMLVLVLAGIASCTNDVPTQPVVLPGDVGFVIGTGSEVVAVHESGAYFREGDTIFKCPLEGCDGEPVPFHSGATGRLYTGPTQLHWVESEPSGALVIRSCPYTGCAQASTVRAPANTFTIVGDDLVQVVDDGTCKDPHGLERTRQAIAVCSLADGCASLRTIFAPPCTAEGFAPPPVVVGGGDGHVVWYASENAKIRVHVCPLADCSSPVTIGDLSRDPSDETVTLNVGIGSGHLAWLEARPIKREQYRVRVLACPLGACDSPTLIAEADAPEGDTSLGYLAGRGSLLAIVGGALFFPAIEERPTYFSGAGYSWKYERCPLTGCSGPRSFFPREECAFVGPANIAQVGARIVFHGAYRDPRGFVVAGVFSAPAP